MLQPGVLVMLVAVTEAGASVARAVVAGPDLSFHDQSASGDHHLSDLPQLKLGQLWMTENIDLQATITHAVPVNIFTKITYSSKSHLCCRVNRNTSPLLGMQNALTAQLNIPLVERFKFAKCGDVYC